uniref:Transmembrane protein n=1 Tax=Glossina austeni TaxID=7395 RepID=A0A1A9ULI0_GLOAU
MANNDIEEDLYRPLIGEDWSTELTTPVIVLYSNYQTSHSNTHSGKTASFVIVFIINATVTVTVTIALHCIVPSHVPFKEKVANAATSSGNAFRNTTNLNHDES